MHFSPCRPKRERKLPSHMRDDNFEVSLTTGKPSSKKAPVPNETSSAGADEKASDDEDDSEDDDGAGSNFESEDDPERLWCVCQQVSC